MNIDPNFNPNANNPDKQSNLNQQNLKELYDIFYKYMKSQVITKQVLQQKKEQQEQQIEDYLDNNVVPDYHTQFDEYGL